jgi:polyhydroxyalkanoate synthesis regulator phasin
VFIIFVSWALLSALGLIRAKIKVGLDGLTAERQSDVPAESRTAIEETKRELSELQVRAEELVQRLDAVPQGSLAEHDKRIGALEESVRKLSPPFDGDASEGSDA